MNPRHFKVIICQRIISGEKVFQEKVLLHFICLNNLMKPM